MMCSKTAWLTKYLHQTRYRGKILLPRKPPRDKLFDNIKVCNSKFEVNHITPQNCHDTKNLMLEIFYKKAPVPSCLELYKNQTLTPFLEDEIDIFLNSGVSIAFQDLSKGRKVFGAGFSFYFEDDEEDRPELRAEDWHNSAADHIEDTIGSHEERSHIWRNYQLIHLKHYCQKIVREEKADFGVHMSQLALEEPYRGGGILHGIIPDMFKKMSQQIWEKNGIITTVSNFPAFSRFLETHFVGHIKLIDKVPYKNLKLRQENGKLVFESLNNLGSIDYYAIIK